MNIELDQKGRASTSFLASLAGFGGQLNDNISRDAVSAGLNESTLDVDRTRRAEQIEAALSKSKSFQLEKLINEWLSINHGLISIEAFHELGDAITEKLSSTPQGPCKLELNQHCHLPDYWKNTEIHRTTGGWNGHEHMGFIHREIIHRRFVAARYPWKIEQQRSDVLEELPKQYQYDSILEMGCGTGQYTKALKERFPLADIWGCDLSETLLIESQRIANENNWELNLFQAAAENTGLDSDSFDLVTSYILLHELPANIIIKVFEEAFRLLKPGGVIMMSDTQPLREMNKFSEWRTLHRAKYGGEPYWEEANSLNFVEILKDIGFLDVSSYGLDASSYPWITKGIKPNG